MASSVPFGTDDAPDPMTRWRDEPPGLAPAVLLLAALVLAGHLAVNLTTAYGFHRDELLYLAMGEHLRFWRMDFPPLIAVLARLTRAILGSSLTAVRLAPAVAAALLVVLAGDLARRMGGRPAAQIVAALAVIASPLFLRTGNLFQPVVLDQLWWTLALYCLIRLGTDQRPRRGEPARWWLWLGVAGGLGLLTKFSILFLGAAVLAALLLSARRRALLTAWPWLALALALLIGSPSIVGQIRLGWPVLGQLHDLRSTQLERVTAGAYLGGQLLYGPAVLLAALGLGWLLMADDARPFRLAGWSCLLAFLLLLLLHGKAYYIGPIYPVLFAAGSVMLGRLAGAGGRVLRIGLPVLIVAYGLFILPVGVPILPPATMVRYVDAVNLRTATRTNEGGTLPLPQDYADMLGWPELARATAGVYHGLPAEDQARAVIVGSNYGRTGAIDLFGPVLGLPHAVSPAGSYWFFGPGTRPGDVTILVGGDSSEVAPYFREVVRREEVRNPLGVAEEQRVPIFVCRGPLHTLQEMWPRLAGRN